MNSHFYALPIVAMLAAGPGSAISDNALSIKKQDLVGAWRYETSYIEFPDGHRESQFGEHPQGLFIILPNGWYSHVIMRDDLPRYSSGLMQKATDEEAQAVVRGSVPNFGTWTLDEREGTFTVHVLWSAFPNSVGQEQRCTILELTKDSLHYVLTSSGQDAGVYALASAGHGARVHTTLSRLWKPD
jgi:hypothetical protein